VESRKRKQRDKEEKNLSDEDRKLGEKGRISRRISKRKPFERRESRGRKGKKQVEGGRESRRRETRKLRNGQK
jgi:hypothetical protein